MGAPPRGSDRRAGEAIAVWNPCLGGTVQAEGVLELDLPAGARRSPALHLRDEISSFRFRLPGLDATDMPKSQKVMSFLSVGNREARYLAQLIQLCVGRANIHKRETTCIIVAMQNHERRKASIAFYHDMLALVRLG